MTRLAGFVGGVVLSGSTIYLCITELRSRTHYNSFVLRESRARLEALQKPATLPENPKPYIARPSLLETMKDRWNAELEGIWRWSQNLDHVKLREGLEEKAGNVVANLAK
ncbi:hypothetical protein BZA77DRAFT_290558 [Pyronema omphalodes]|nr:hypothetical protein BZA77DRAFT_290558 [Pyronema omphalodes]